MPKQSIFLICGALLLFSHAVQAKIGIDIEPIVGYERNQKLTPTPHTNDRFVYGGLVTVGVPLLSAELEYTRGEATESFPLQNLSSKDTTERARVGLRTRLRLSRVFHVYFRAGAEAKRSFRTDTVGATVTTTDEPIQYHPYGGGGLRVRITRAFSLTAGLTVIFNNFPDDLARNEYQTTAGFNIRLGSTRGRR